MNNLSNVLLQFFSEYPVAPSRRSPVLIACSGGPDSVALARTFAFIQPRLHFSAVLGHVNHKTRGVRSEGDEKFVRALGKELRLPVMVMKSPAAKGSGNLEEKLRVNRYAALSAMAKKSRAKLILTAHTQDDQLETILMNLARGTGLSGAGGIPPLRKVDRVRFVGRPFLGISKEFILRALARNKANFRVDHTNRSKKMTRNWVRHVLLPEWEKRIPGMRVNLIRFGRQARESMEFLDAVVSDNGAGINPWMKGKKIIDYEKFSKIHPVLQRAFLRQGIGKDLLTFASIERLRNWMGRLPKGGRLFELKQGWVVERLTRARSPQKKTSFRVYRDLRRIQLKTSRDNSKN